MFQTCVQKRLSSTAYPFIFHTIVHDSNQTLHVYVDVTELHLSDTTISATPTTHITYED